MSEQSFPLGKLPLEILNKILATTSMDDPRLVLGPGIGLDCAVVEAGSSLIVLKSDPITFTSDAIGWYAVQVNANDIATTGAQPRWFMVTMLLPEGRTTAALVEDINSQIQTACRHLGITVIGGHSEITQGLARPILIGTMIGEVEREKLITPRGASPGNRLLLTKGVPIEATSILGRECAERISKDLSPAEVRQAANFLYEPGISIVKDAHLALSAGRVTAMHDPTEGGLASALWELAIACGHSIIIDPAAVPIPPLSRRICQSVGINPLAAIASGALLLATPAEDAATICQALQVQGIPCAEIGAVENGSPLVWQRTATGRTQLPLPARDEIARLFEELD